MVVVVVADQEDVADENAALMKEVLREIWET
jgi:hypothetical protein